MASAARTTRLALLPQFGRHCTTTTTTGGAASRAWLSPRVLPQPSLRLPAERAFHCQARAPLVSSGRIQSQRRRLVRWESQQATTPKQYSFDEINSQLFSASPSSKPVILVDVREPHELKQTGRIPGARNLPVSTLPGHLFLPPDEFEDALGWQKPQAGDEVVFYCKAGVRSRAVAAMVREEWGKNGVKVAEFPGSWSEWSSKGGKAEKVD